MTTRLLRASLGSPTYDDMRRVLRAEGAVEVLHVRNLVLRASALPVFKTGPRQLVRVSVHGDGQLDVTARDGDRVLDTARLAAPGVADLFVPAVDTSTTITLELADSAGPVGTGTFVVTPQRRWTVHLVHHSHLDIGYTDRQGVVLRNHLEYLDAALELAAQTDDWPEPARFRWTVESALPVRSWLAARSPAAVTRFLDLARTGRIEVTAMPYQLHTEACSVEELHRLLRFTDDLRTEHDIPVTSAMHTDVPGAAIGFVDALAASGVRYLSAAHNWAGRSVPFLHGGQDLGRPFWWRSPAGNRLLVWVTDTPHGMAYMEGNVVGLADGYTDTTALLPGYLHALATRAYPYGAEAFGWAGLPEHEVTKTPYPHDVLHLRVQGGHADNAGPSIIPADVVRAWNEEYDYPRLRMSLNTDFFTEAEERLGDRLPEYEGDWTDWWADGLGSGARPLGYARRAQHAIRHAETLHTLAATRGDEGDVDRELDEVYDGLGLFDEHTWGAANPWHDHEDGFDSGGLQWARKCEHAYRAADHAEDLRHAGLRRLGSTFAAPSGVRAWFLVLNPGPARDDVAELFLPASTVPLGEPLSIVDARTGEPVPFDEDTVHPVEWPTRPAGRRLRFVARAVPALGYARFDLVDGSGPTPWHDLGNEGVVDSEHYRVEYDLRAAVIASLFDKVAGRELANRDAYAGMNQYVYDRYSTAPHINHLSGHVSAEADLALLAGRTLGRRPSIVRARASAVGSTVDVALDGDGVGWLRTTITLPAGVRRVDVTNRLDKSGTPAKESVFFAFPFATGPARAWELTGGTGGPERPTVPGAATHLQPVRHWVGLGDEQFAVGWASLEAPLVMLGDLYLPYAPFPPSVRPEPAEPGTLYSWALNNIWDTNFPSQQQGETTFRYAITSATDADPAELGRDAAAGLTDPMLVVPVTGRNVPVAAAGDSFLSVADPRVRVSSVARSRRGHGFVVYLSADTEVRTEVRLPAPVRAAFLGTSLERDLVACPVRGDTVEITVPPGNLVALAVDLAGGSA
ncbi:glycoside hydrolase family 38 C-terminal domain-containing protein [Virgisporangium aurantiacum]